MVKRQSPEAVLKRLRRRYASERRKLALQVPIPVQDVTRLIASYVMESIRPYLYNALEEHYFLFINQKSIYPAALITVENEAEAKKITESRDPFIQEWTLHLQTGMQEHNLRPSTLQQYFSVCVCTIGGYGNCCNRSRCYFERENHHIHCNCPEPLNKEWIRKRTCAIRQHQRKRDKRRLYS